jgi:16S rRNA (guanine527-N7)-methyltransferase
VRRGGARPTDEHSAALSGLGIPSAAAAPLCEYLELIAAWNERTNLTAARTAEDRVRVLIVDPWLAAPIVRRGSLVDVGSGNGSPGLVLALLRPDLKVTLLEPRARRWAFLRECGRRLGREDIEVVRARCEDYKGPLAQTVTVRAVGIELGEAARLTEGGGEVLVFGGRPTVRPPLAEFGIYPLERSELHVLRRLVPVTGVSRET